MKERVLRCIGLLGEMSSSAERQLFIDGIFDDTGMFDDVEDGM